MRNINDMNLFYIRLDFLVIILIIFFIASDEELFEDNPEEYIRRDIEGSDVDTRRRASCDLVKVCKYHILSAKKFIIFFPLIYYFNIEYS